MRIFHMTAPGQVGGLESVVLALVRGQRAAGHDARVFVSTTPDDAGPDGHGEGHPFIESLRGEAVPVHHVVCPGRRVDREWRATRDAVDTVEPDVVHTHGVRSDLIGGSVALSRGVPVVSTQHGDVTPTARSRVILAFQRIMLRRFAGVVAVSNPLRDRLVATGIPEARVYTIPNAWVGDVEFMEPSAARAALDVPPGTPRLGWVGRVSAEKGPDVFVDALELLNSEGADVAVSIVGDGPMRDRLQARTDAFDSIEVRWHGAIPAAARIFRAFDVFALTSRSEGTPIVLLEAMAAGVPIVATAVGGVPDVTGTEGAELVAPEAPAALADAIRTLLTRADLRERVVNVSRIRLATEFAADSWYLRYDHLYETVTSAVHRSSSLTGF